jgi:hypothetical protein
MAATAEHAAHDESAASEVDAAVKPKGVGTAVAFTWALAAQMLSAAGFAIADSVRQHEHAVLSGPAAGIPTPVIVLGYLVAAGFAAAIGEALRAGRRWAWGILVALTAVLSIAGLVMLPTTISLIARHNFWPLYVQVILIGLVPFILYRLVQPETRRWYASVSAAAARLRHGAPAWLATIIACAAAGGFLTAWIERQF